MKIYVSGPMTGLPEKNYPAFKRVTTTLRATGHEVYCPSEYKDDGREFVLREGFKEYTSWICDHAEGIFMLSGWEASKGARAEHALAVALELRIMYENFKPQTSPSK